MKTRIQIDPAFKSHTFISGARHVVAAEGPRGLLTGFGPTAVGYLAQGGAKFAGYEYWKKKFVEVAGDQEVAVRNRTVIYLGAATIAEYAVRMFIRPTADAHLDSSPIYYLLRSKQRAFGLCQTVSTRLGLSQGSPVLREKEDCVNYMLGFSRFYASEYN